MTAYSHSNSRMYLSIVAAAVGVCTTATHAQIVFAPPVSVAIAVRPDTVAAGDLDGDTDVDLAVTSDTPDKIWVLLNNGDGSFAPPVVILTGAGTGAGHITAVDLDGDLDLDLAVALKNIDSVRVYINNGAAVFTAGGTFPVGLNPLHIAADDFDNDNDIDLASVNRDSNDVSVLLNDGSGSFGPETIVAVELDPREVTAGDFDGDTDVDLAVTNHDSRTISVLANNGSGTFSVAGTLSVGAAFRPDGITSGDLDGDTDLDLAVTTSDVGPSFAAIFTNNGAGTFSGPVNFPVGGSGAGSIVANDLDCDGDLDLATANRDSNDVSWLANSGNATFGAPGTMGVGLAPDHVAAADLDGDAAPDLVTTNPDSDDISILINLSAGCEPVGDPGVATFPHDRRKNRYISFDPNKTANDGINVSFKVELKAITLGSCDGAGGGATDFCRADRVPPTLDCNACSGAGNPCINQPIDCLPGQTCDATGETCVNDAPNSGGSNVGLVWWIGPEKTTAPADSSVHLLVSEPFRKISTGWPNPTHAGDCEVVPEAVYGVRAVNADSAIESAELLVETTLYSPTSASWWADCVGPLKKFCGGDIRTPECTSDGDCTLPETCDLAWTLPDGSVNFDDVGAALALVAPGPTSVPPDKTWVDLHGNDSGTSGSQNFDPPNFVANFSDIGQIIFGFQGLPYKGYDPADCPDTGTWP